MAVRNNEHRSLLFGVFVFLVVIVAVALNLPQLSFEPLKSWVGIAVPALLLLGLLGSAFNSKPLRLAGWIGLGYFVLVVLATAVPGEDYVLGGPKDVEVPRQMSGVYVLLRLVLMSMIAIALIICFRKLAGPNPDDPAKPGVAPSAD